MDVIEPRLVFVNGGRYRFFESSLWSAENDSIERSSAENHDFQPFDDQSDEEFDESLAEKSDACNNAGEFDDLYAEKFDSTAEGSNDSIAEDSDEIVDRKSERANDRKTHDFKEEKATDIRVLPLPKSGFLHTFAVNKRFYPIIVGRGGDIKKKLEIKTNTVIAVPRAHEDDEVSIKGPSKEGVISARRQLDMIINDAKRYIGNVETSDSLPAANSKNIDSFDDEEFGESCAEKFDGCNTGEFANSDSNAEKADKSVNQTSKSANDRKTRDIKEEKTTDIHVVPLPKSGYIHTFVVNKRFYPIIVGRQGVIKNKLEVKTNTVIVVPRAHEGDEISIKGPSKEAVISARRQLDWIINDARRYVGNIETIAPSPATNARNVDSFDNEEFGESSAEKVDHFNAGEFGDLDAERVADSNAEESDEIVNQMSKSANDRKIHENKEEKITDIHVVPLPKSGYKHTFVVNKRFYPIIVGRRGVTQNKLEIDTNTVIVVPKADESDQISIKGPSKEAVISARLQLDWIINDARRYVGNIETIAPLPATNARNVESFDNEGSGESFAEKVDHYKAGEFGDPDADKVADSNAEESDKIVNQMKKSADDRKIHDIKEEKTTDIHVVPLPKSGYKHTFVVNKRFYPIIVGRQGFTKNKLEIETNTSIVVPRAREGDEISIKGPSKEAVISARRQLDSIIKDARRYVGNIETIAPLSATDTRNIDSFDGLQNAPIRNNTRPSNVGATTPNNSYEVTETSNPDPKTENSIDSSVSTSNHPINNASCSPGSKMKTFSPSNQTIESSIPRSVPPRKNTYTHFLSIPMISETVISNYQKFTNALLEGSSKDFPGVRLEVFRKPAKLHVALGMLSLRNDEAVAAAAMALEQCKETIIKPIIEEMGPIAIRVQGLKGAFFEPYYIKVLYAQILTKNNVLLQIAQKIEKFLVCAGLMERPAKKLEIHMTLMNTSFDQRNQGKKFNARNIVKDYENFFFGEIELSTIHISKRGEYAENGYYSTSVKVDVP